MSEMFVEPTLEKGARERIIELNVERFEYGLRHMQWHLKPGTSTEEVSAEYYALESGMLCDSADEDVVYRGVSHFIREKGNAAVLDTRVSEVDTGTSAPEPIQKLIKESAEMAAEQLSNFPRLIPGTPKTPPRNRM